MCLFLSPAYPSFPPWGCQSLVSPEIRRHGQSLQFKETPSLNPNLISSHALELRVGTSSKSRGYQFRQYDQGLACRRHQTQMPLGRPGDENRFAPHLLRAIARLLSKCGHAIQEESMPLFLEGSFYFYPSIIDTNTLTI